MWESYSAWYNQHKSVQNVHITCKEVNLLYNWLMSLEEPKVAAENFFFRNLSLILNLTLWNRNNAYHTGFYVKDFFWTIPKE